jgi:four helix bundle protein
MDIAEGFERNGNKEFIQSLFQLQKHPVEKQDHSCIGFMIENLFHRRNSALIELTETLSKKINSFIKYLNTTDLKGTKYKP